MFLFKTKDVNARDASGRTDLYKAASHGSLSLVRSLLKRKDIIPDLTGADGRTPLSIAASRGLSLAEVGLQANHADGFVAVVQMLANRSDVDVNCLDNMQQSPLAWAVLTTDLSSSIVDPVVSLLVSHPKVDVNGAEGMLPLILAIKRHDVVNTRLLLTSSNVDVGAIDLQPDDSLIRSIVRKCQRRDVPLKDYGRLTALMWAVVVGEMEIIIDLLSAGANIDQHNEYNYTALMLAAELGRIGVVHHLLTCNVFELNQHSESAMSLADDAGFEDIVNVLAAYEDELAKQDKDIKAYEEHIGSHKTLDLLLDTFYTAEDSDL